MLPLEFLARFTQFSFAAWQYIAMDALAESNTASGITPKDECHIWRSKFFDQSARCEMRLRRVFMSHRPTDAVPHQFKALSIAVKQFSDDKTCSEKLVPIIEELLPLIELRAYLAHSAMRLMALNGDHVLAFAQAGGDQEYGQKVMMLTTVQRTSALKKMTSLANRLKNYLQGNRST